MRDGNDGNDECGSKAGGTSPSCAERKGKKHNEQIKRARQLGRDMFETSKSKDGLKIDPRSKHWPHQKQSSRKPGKKTRVTDSVTCFAATATTTAPATDPLYCDSTISLPSVMPATSLSSNSTLIFPSAFPPTEQMLRTGILRAMLVKRKHC